MAGWVLVCIVVWCMVHGGMHLLECGLRESSEMLREHIVQWALGGVERERQGVLLMAKQGRQRPVEG